MKIDGFEWDGANIVKNIIGHNTYPDEIEELFYNKYKLRKTKQDRYLLYGVTDSGRYLFVVFMIKKKALRGFEWSQNLFFEQIWLVIKGFFGKIGLKMPLKCILV